VNKNIFLSLFFSSLFVLPATAKTIWLSCGDEGGKGKVPIKVGLDESNSTFLLTRVKEEFRGKASFFPSQIEFEVITYSIPSVLYLKSVFLIDRKSLNYEEKEYAQNVAISNVVVLLAHAFQNNTALFSSIYPTWIGIFSLNES
jgi:hypothetical protein